MIHNHSGEKSACGLQPFMRGMGTAAGCYGCKQPWEKIMRKALIFFLAVFVLSIIFLAYLSQSGETSGALPGEGSSKPAALVWVPLVTAIASLVGAVTTSVFAIQQNRRETKKTELELAKLNLEIKDKEIELAKKQRELDALQKDEDH